MPAIIGPSLKTTHHFSKSKSPSHRTVRPILVEGANITREAITGVGRCRPQHAAHSRKNCKRLTAPMIKKAQTFPGVVLIYSFPCISNLELYSSTTRTLFNFSPPHSTLLPLSNVLSALSKLGHRDALFLDGLCEESVPQAKDFSPKELAGAFPRPTLAKLEHPGPASVPVAPPPSSKSPPSRPVSYRPCTSLSVV